MIYADSYENMAVLAKRLADKYDVKFEEVPKKIGNMTWHTYKITFDDLTIQTDQLAQAALFLFLFICLSK